MHSSCTSNSIWKEEIESIKNNKKFSDFNNSKSETKNVHDQILEQIVPVFWDFSSLER
jgi:hypothetical protein